MASVSPSPRRVPAPLPSRWSSTRGNTRIYSTSFPAIQSTSRRTSSRAMSRASLPPANGEPDPSGVEFERGGTCTATARPPAKPFHLTPASLPLRSLAPAVVNGSFGPTRDGCHGNDDPAGAHPRRWIGHRGRMLVKLAVRLLAAAVALLLAAAPLAEA